jgi:hypothetical protein
MAGDRLFMNLDVVQVGRQCAEAAQRAVAKLTEAELRAGNSDEITQDVVAEKVPRQIRLDTANHGWTDRIVPIPAQQGLAYGGIIMPSARRAATEGVELRLHIPYAGTPQAFTYRPSRMLMQPPTAEISDREVILSVIDVSGESSTAEEHLLDQERNLQQWVDSLNDDLQKLEREIRSLVAGRLAERLAVLQQRDSLVAGLTIPARHVEPDRALEIPARRTMTLLTAGSAHTDRASAEWSLTDAVYEQVIKTITGFTRALERRPASALQLLPDEETLRDWLLFLLNANYEAPDGSALFVGGETVNGKGKTDILVRHQDRNAFIGECKFWDGPSKFDEAIEQLLDYIVWRDAKAAIILFITRRNATAAITSAGGRLAAHACCRQAKVPDDPSVRRDYAFVSPRDDQRNISVALLPVVIPEGKVHGG